MVISCVAFGCQNRQVSHGKKVYVNDIPISFHRFPDPNKKKELHGRWLRSVKRWKWNPTKYSFLCSEHFFTNDYKVPPWESRPRLKNGTVPSVFPKYPKHLHEKCVKKRKTRNSTSSTKLPVYVNENKRYIPVAVDNSVALQEKIKLMQKKIKSLQQKVRRREKKMKSMKDLIGELKNRKLITEASADNLEDQFSGITKEVFRNELRNKGRRSTGRRYSDEFKKFTLTVNFYSPKAYNFLRKIFYLPHQSSIRQWSSSVNCEPGFLSEVFADLKRQVSNDIDMSDCALLLDGMAIRKQIIYDQAKSKYIGFVDYGNLVPENSEAYASEALVFMLVGLKSKWKCPVGYFLIDKCNADNQTSLIKTCLSLAADNGLRISSVTCDGTSTNISSLKNLGCVFTDDIDTSVVKFKHPTRDYYVYATLDACHMLKLARNCLGDLGHIQSDTGVISWKYIQCLHTLQESEGFNLANKLHTGHVNWRKQKMKVKLAAQTLSSSVADALEFLEKDAKLPEFQNCSATIEFIRYIDRMFDFLNSRHKLMGGFKQPITKANFEYLKLNTFRIAKYLLSLRDMNGQRMIHHKRKTFIVGFVSTAKSVLSLAEELLSREIKPYHYLLTYKVSQDHLELFFGCVRSRGGYNNNPNAIQFKTAIKQILVKNSIMSSSKGNVLCFESQSVGSLFSLKWSKRRSPLSELNGCEMNHTTGDPDFSNVLDGVTKITENILYYISGFILRGIVTSLDCEECSEALLTPTSDHQYSYSYVSFINRKDRGGLLHASYGVYKVILTCEKSFKINVLNKCDSRISTESKLIQHMVFEVLQSFDWNHYFPSISDHGFHVEVGFEDDHLTQIIKRMAYKYLNMRLHTYAKRYTREVLNKDKPSIRHQLTKLVLFKNM